jgi:DNA/RNA-binding domain of Phe-tRNA-synthetase-like protein
MRFTIQPAIFDLFAGLRIPVAVALGIDNSGAQPEIEAEWREAWAEASAAAAYGNPQSQPRIRPWRDRFRAMGISGKEFPSSAEALLRRALKGGEPFSVNPLVDFYNTVSLRHLVPAGAYDLDQLEGDLALRLTRAGDSFWSLDAAEPVDVEAGEVAYADDRCILTRHFVWRQAREALIGLQTRNVLLLSEVLGEVGGEVAEAVLADFGSGLQARFGVEPRCLAMMSAEQPSVMW